MMVQELAIRHFTVISDRLLGISGIAAAMELPEMGAYFAGVWSWNPFLSMAWHGRTSQKPPTEYRSPTWSWVWTTDQLIWHFNTWAINVGPEVKAEWAAWDAKWGPRLLDRHILLEGTNAKGEVAKGSYITISGHCRRMVFTEQREEEYFMWGYAANELDECTELGTHAHLDWRPNGWASEARFEEDVHGEEVDNGEESRTYLCVQILRERKRHDFNPKVLAMILDEDEEEGTYKRVGIVELDLDEGEGERDKWERRTLKLV
jgi:hypothetical protein